MLGLKKSVRLHGLPKHPNIILSSKTSSRSFATAISTGRNLSVFNKGVAARPTHNKKSTATFSTQSHGLRKLLYRDDPWSPEMKKLDPHKARIAFLKTNPFNDAAAHNCCLRFRGVARHEDDYTDGKTVRGWFDREIDILQDELKQLVRLAKKADNTTEWPMVMVFNELSSLWPTGTFEIVFKMPGIFNPHSFFRRLRDLNLENGEFVKAEGALSQSADWWWHRFLYCLPEEQKYWVHGSGGARAGSSTEDHKSRNSMRQPTVRDRYGMGRKPAVIVKNRSYATSTLGLRSKRPVLSSTFVQARKNGAPFSTQSHGLREGMWTDLTWKTIKEVDPAAARLAFDQRNLFNDTKAHNCILRFESVKGLLGPEGLYPNKQRAMKRFKERANIVQRELNKLVSPTDETKEWPVFVKFMDSTNSFRDIDVHICFKVPHTEVPDAFVEKLREAGLKGGKLVTLGGEELTDDRWYRLLHCMSEEDKYWVEPNSKTQKTASAEEAKNEVESEESKSEHIATCDEEDDATRTARDLFFNDPHSQNCQVVFEGLEDDQVRPQVKILYEELGRALNAAGEKTAWPIITEGPPFIMKETIIYFKVPGSVNLGVFKDKMYELGLVDGMLEELGREWDVWWTSELCMLRMMGLIPSSVSPIKTQTTSARKKHTPHTTGRQTPGHNQGGHRPILKRNNNAGKRSYATTSKDHSTKPTLVIEYHTIPVEEVEAAAATWDTINPFNEPLTRNCALIIENVPLVRDEDGKLEHTATHHQYDTQVDMILTAMDETLKGAGNKAHWPTLGMLQDARIPRENLPYDFHIYFRLPASEELGAFEARLKKAGLESGYLEDLGHEFDKWWHSTLWGMAKGGFSIPAHQKEHE